MLDCHKSQALPLLIRISPAQAAVAKHDEDPRISSAKCIKPDIDWTRFACNRETAEADGSDSTSCEHVEQFEEEQALAGRAPKRSTKTIGPGATKESR